MSFEAALATVKIATTIIGTGMSVIGQFSAGQQQQAHAKAQARQAEYQAEAERRNAAYIAANQRQRAEYEQERAAQMRTAGEVAKLQKEQEGERLLSKQLSLYGASGVEPSVWSPLAVMEETAALVERDALMERYRYELGASEAEMSGRSLEASATLQDIQGRTQGALYDYQAKGYRSQAGSIARSTAWKAGGTLITGLAPLLQESTWKPFQRG